jgi:hypothetical protein
MKTTLADILTPMTQPIYLRTNAQLNGTFGPDRNKAIIVKIVPGTETVPDVLELRPERSRRVERIAIIDVYRFAIRSRVNREHLELARVRKEKKAIRLAAQRQQRAERKLRSMPNE